jgi:hypothetical protein
MSEEKKADGASEVLYDFEGCRVRNISPKVAIADCQMPNAK